MNLRRAFPLLHQPARQHGRGIFLHPQVEQAGHFLGLSEPSWVNWTEQIRHRRGKELLSRGMFPPRKYLTSTE